MKFLFLLLAHLLAIVVVSGQSLVLDESKILELSENQLVLLPAIASAENSAESLKEIRQKISAKATLVHTLQEKLYTALSQVPDGVSTLGKLRSCQRSASDIYQLQQEIILLSGEDQRLMTVALGLSGALAERTAGLVYTLREGVLQGGEENLVSVAQRLELLGHLEKELKALRGICLQVRRRLRLLKKGVMGGADIDLPDYDATIVTGILREKK